VSPAWTSQKCHVCGEKGLRVETQDSTTERRAGEFFYCPHCGEQIHADVNAARNILDSHTEQPSAVAGRTI
jgi:transposase